MGKCLQIAKEIHKCIKSEDRFEQIKPGVPLYVLIQK